jgi:hypothetical protein
VADGGKLDAITERMNRMRHELAAIQAGKKMALLVSQQPRFPLLAGPKPPLLLTYQPTQKHEAARAKLHEAFAIGLPVAPAKPRNPFAKSLARA